MYSDGRSQAVANRPKAAARISLQKLGSSLDEEIEPC